MERTFYGHGSIASDSLIAALIADAGAWAHAVLSQNYGVPETWRTALLEKKAVAIATTAKGITITWQESP